jgi:hypothetical protein
MITARETVSTVLPIPPWTRWVGDTLPKEGGNVTDQGLVSIFIVLFHLLLASHYQYRAASASSHMPLCHMTPADPMWSSITWHDRLWPLVLAMTQVGAVLIMTHTISISSHMTYFTYCWTLTHVGCFPLSLTLDDLLRNVPHVYKDCSLGAYPLSFCLNLYSIPCALFVIFIITD